MIKIILKKRGWPVFKGLIIAAVMVLASGFAVQAAALRVISVAAEAKGEKLVLRVALSAEAKPRVFAMDVKGAQPRVVIDFLAAVASRLPARLASPSPLAVAIRLGSHPDKIRLVIDLVPGGVYKVEQWWRRDIKEYVLILSTGE